MRCGSCLEQLHESGEGAVVLVDCLTLWLTNWLLHYERRARCIQLVTKQIDELVEVVSSYSGQLIMVTNEVGDGIVPEYPLGRNLVTWLDG